MTFHNVWVKETLKKLFKSENEIQKIKIRKFLNKQYLIEMINFQEKVYLILF